MRLGQTNSVARICDICRAIARVEWMSLQAWHPEMTVKCGPTVAVSAAGTAFPTFAGLS